jgi:tetratricopeptide (TPR) repeat protein
MLLFIPVKLMPDSSLPKDTKPDPKPWAGPLKVVGIISATISFFLALNQITGVVQNFRIHHKEFREAMQAGEQAEKRQDYRAAYDSFKHATDLDPVDRQAQQSQLEAGMLLLENVHGTAEHSFTDTANMLLPVFDKALAKSKGTMAADIQAHEGWANYLRYRDGAREGVVVEDNYRKALEKDPSNAYAHAMWGFWILWQGGPLDTANQHFNVAVASGQHKDYVRSLQLGALLNRQKDDTDIALLRVANDMRKNNEPLSSEDRHSVIWNSFTVRLHDHDRLATILQVLPAEEMQATYDWLVEGGQEATDTRIANGIYIKANLQEIAGDREHALATYRSLSDSLKGSRSTLIPQVDDAIKRLSSGKKK